MDTIHPQPAPRPERTWRHLLQAAALFRIIAKKMGSDAEQVNADKAMNRITINQARIFWYIFESANQEIRIKSLAHDLNVSSAAVSQVVDRLVSAGLLHREPDPTDRRAVILSIAAKGHALLEEIDRRSCSLQEDIFNGIDLPKEDFEAFNRVLSKMHEQLDLRWRSLLDHPEEIL